MPEIGERAGSYQCVCCHALWDGPETWLDPFDFDRLCCGEPECRAAVEQVSVLPLRIGDKITSRFFEMKWADSLQSGSVVAAPGR